MQDQSGDEQANYLQSKCEGYPCILDCRGCCTSECCRMRRFLGIVPQPHLHHLLGACLAQNQGLVNFLCLNLATSKIFHKCLKDMYGWAAHQGATAVPASCKQVESHLQWQLLELQEQDNSLAVQMFPLFQRLWRPFDRVRVYITVSVTCST